MSQALLTGSCLCGAVAYALDEAPTWAHYCHCGRCRKALGSAFAANLFVGLEAFRWTRGEDRLRSYKPPEAERFTHVFCADCGSSLPFENRARERAVVPMGSLDQDPGHPPDAHIFVDSKAAWHEITDALPRYRDHLDSERIDD